MDSKKFSQEEVNRIVTVRVKREREKLIKEFEMKMKKCMASIHLILHQEMCALKRDIAAEPQEILLVPLPVEWNDRGLPRVQPRRIVLFDNRCPRLHAYRETGVQAVDYRDPFVVGDRKYLSDSRAGIFWARPVTTTCRSRSSHGKSRHTALFSARCCALRLSRLVKKTKPRSSRPFNRMVRRSGLPSAVDVASDIAVGSTICA